MEDLSFFLLYLTKKLNKQIPILRPLVALYVKCNGIKLTKDLYLKCNMIICEIFHKWSVLKKKHLQKLWNIRDKDLMPAGYTKTYISPISLFNL